ncbi:hypothetical protein [Acetivibrio straminisolvens]|nr:hypothetical protein [Acetivibrio straminisolvens]
MVHHSHLLVFKGQSYRDTLNHEISIMEQGTRIYTCQKHIF